MHIILSDAAPTGPACQAALGTLRLPTLNALLGQLEAAPPMHGNASDLSPASERALAQALGLEVTDGLLPWAELDAQSHNLTASLSLTPSPFTAQDGWAWITPCHWRVHADHVTMADTATLKISKGESEALLQAMQSYFAQDGITLLAHHLAHQKDSSVDSTQISWLACGPVFKDLPTASLLRVSGRGVDPWLPRQPQARTLRRLQNEMQMLLYTHPVNTRREAEHLSTINSFWVSGTGALQVNKSDPARTTLETSAAQMLTDLRNPMLQDDPVAWRDVWNRLENEALATLLEAAHLGKPVSLTLCGENSAQSFHSPTTRPGFLSRMTARWRQVDAISLLRNL